MNDRLHKSIYGQTLDEMKENKGAWEYKQEPYICDTCKHNDKEWDEEPCDGCCGNHSGYEPSGDVISRQAVEDKLVKLCNELEEVFANIRMMYVDESVCGLCEYDCPAPFECKGVETNECFKLADEIRHKWQSTKDLPSVKQERTGHWIERPHIYGVAFCSECGFELKINDTKYCPNCGAKMIEQKESEEV